MRAMDDAVENGIGQRGIAQVFMPAIDRQLTRDDRRSVAVPVVENLEEVLSLCVLEPDEAPIIKNQDVDARKAGQHGRVRAVTMGERELGKEARNPSVDHAMIVAAGLLAERTREIGLADAGGAGDQNVLMLGDPAVGGELADQRPIEFPAAVVEIFETSVTQFEFGFLEPAAQRAILARELLGIDEDAEALIETERRGRGIALLRRDRRRPWLRAGDDEGVRSFVQSACGSSCW
jgi:hypothetical protein